jgi:N-methylhydantoinase B
MPAMICLNDGDTHNGPVEASEAHNYNFGIVIRRELRKDSGGAGKFRGGLGTVGEVIYFRDFMFNSHMERTVCAPWGALGAKDGKTNHLEIRETGGQSATPPYSAKEVLSIPLEVESFPNQKHPNAKMANVALPGGSWVVVMPGGGGGFGNPRERDVSKVEDDVVNGYVSIESAERDYGVAISRTTMRIGEERTEMLRKSAH